MSAYSAVVVVYESGELLDACVASLVADTSAGEAPEVVVVDNGSRDGSTGRVERAFPTARVVRAARNLGYAGGANLGIAETHAPIVAVLNADTTVVAGTAGTLLTRFEAEADLAAVGPRIDDVTGTRYPSARRVPSVTDAVGHGVFGLFWRGNPFTRRYRELDADPDRSRDVDWVSGAAIWLRRTALDAVGGWDAGFFMYVEEVDLCSRLRGAGWRVSYEPRGRVVHVQGASTARRPLRMVLAHHRSLLRFAAKRWTGWRRVLLLPAGVFLAARCVVVMGVTALSPRPKIQKTSG